MNKIKKQQPIIKFSFENNLRHRLRRRWWQRLRWARGTNGQK